jgi:hypothetical protein
MPQQRLPFVCISVLVAALALGCAAPARAQTHGPVGGFPGVRSLPVGVPGLGSPAVGNHGAGMSASGFDPALQHLDDVLHEPRGLTRKLQIKSLLRREPARVAVDPQGAPILRGEFLAMGLLDAQLDGLRALGFVTDSKAPADATLGLDLLVLRDSRGRTAAAAMQDLRQVAPNATFTYQYLYFPAAANAGDAAQESMSAATPSSASPRRIGLIDGGVDRADPALARAHLEPYGCDKPTVSRHGTLVAERLVDGDPDTLYAADLWCGNAVGGTTSSLVNALAWMAREHVPVINISLVGPDNPVLARAVQIMIARGHVLVSAVGNDGPAAPPLFPAAYPGVIGVSGVDADGHVLPESGSGSQVTFCALGLVGRGRGAMRGTSFASPIVARRAAQLLAAPEPGAAARVIQQLAREARDLGPVGRDPRYGYGLLSP